MKDGFINLNKEAGMTSHDAVNRVRRIFNTKKVGHSGTLDPFATGVLPMAVGRATGFLEYLSNLDKSYRACLMLGIETDTGDFTGNIVRFFENFGSGWVWKRPKRLSELQSTLKEFTGTITQVPPKYSAVKINGHKAYELARRGIKFDLPTREVTIHRLELITYTENSLTIKVDCSKGTYIRSLAVDLGHALGTYGTLRSLQRTRVGEFKIANSVTLEELSVDNIIPIEDCLTHLPRIDLPAYRLKAFFNGLTTRLDSNFNEGTIFRVYCDDEFIGTGKIVSGELKAAKAFKNEA